MTQVSRKIYLSLYWKGCVWEGVGDWTELQHIDPHSIGHNSVSFLFSWATQPGAWEPTLLGVGFLYRTLSPTDWISCAPSYIIVWHPPSSWGYTHLLQLNSTFFLWASQFTLIQPVHGQGYILIFLNQMHSLFTQVHFLYWQLGRVGGQYTTRRDSIQSKMARASFRI